MGDAPTSVVLLSGGPDSSTMAGWAKSTGRTPVALHVDYGQAAAAREREAAESVAGGLGIELALIDMPGFMKPLIPHLPKGFAVDDSHAINAWCGGPALPFAIGLSVAVAANYALVRGADAVLIGINATELRDAASQQFSRHIVDEMQEAIRGAASATFSLETPFANREKTELLQQANELGVDLARTWSCSLGHDIHCGKCHPCWSRHKAFLEVFGTDLTHYESDPSDLPEEPRAGWTVENGRLTPILPA